MFRAACYHRSMAKKPKDLTSLRIEVPRALRLFVAERSKDRNGSASEYVSELIRKDQQRFEQVLNAKLLEGLESPAVEVTPAFWEALRRRIRQKDRIRKIGR